MLGVALAVSAIHSCLSILFAGIQCLASITAPHTNKGASGGEGFNCTAEEDISGSLHFNQQSIFTSVDVPSLAKLVGCWIHRWHSQIIYTQSAHDIDLDIVQVDVVHEQFNGAKHYKHNCGRENDQLQSCQLQLGCYAYFRLTESTENPAQHRCQI